MNDNSLKLVIFAFTLSIIFPTLAYTFTTFGEYTASYDATLDQSTLIDAGIQLEDALSHNVTFGGAHQEYNVSQTVMRVKWTDSPIWGAYFANQRQSFIDQILGLWLFPKEMNVELDQSEGVIDSKSLNNVTIINNFDPQFNWTLYECLENQMYVFITPLKSDNNNITKAILETGIVTVTVGSPSIGSIGSVTFLNFVNWYRKVVFTGGSEWGMPSFMTWIVRVFSFLTLLSGLLLARHLVPIS